MKYYDKIFKNYMNNNKKYFQNQKYKKYKNQKKIIFIKERIYNIL